jgi:ABC-type branched-subunit amino acid transport system substrate-binding protein
MTKLLSVALGAMLFMGTSCGSSGGSSSEPDLRVTVATGIDQTPVAMQGATRAVARYFADSDKVLYVSGFQYSSTCIPEGRATQDGGTITLSVKSPSGNCTADAGRDTFQIEPVTSDPKRLVIVEAGQPDIRLDLSS